MTNISKIIKSQLTIPLTILLSGIYLLLDFFVSAPADMTKEVKPVTGLITFFLPDLSLIWNSTALTVIALLSAFLLLQIIDQYSLIREKSTLPFVFFLTISLQYIGINTSVASAATVFFLGLSYLFLFYSYQQEKSQRAIFNFALFFSVASLFCLDLIWLTPLLFVALVFMRVVNIKNVAAVLFGIAAPYIIAVFPYFILGKQHEILSAFTSLIQFQLPDPQSWGMEEIIHSATTLVMILVTAFSLKFGLSQDKVRVRSSFDFLLLMYFVLFGLSLFKNSSLEAFHWSADFLAAYFLANYFTTKKGRAVNYLFWIALFLYILTGFLVL
ncbi:MAG: hypothetical protein ACRCZQ_03915 [Bacteroidales bacterium]